MPRPASPRDWYNPAVVPSPQPPRKSKGSEETRLLWRMAGMGFWLASAAGGGVALGWLLDHLLGTSPLWLIIGGIAGITVGMADLFRSAYRLMKSMDKRRAGPQRPAAGATEHEDDGDRQGEDG
jgi:hypothetical protein